MTTPNPTLAGLNETPAVRIHMIAFTRKDDKWAMKLNFADYLQSNHWCLFLYQYSVETYLNQENMMLTKELMII